MNIIIEFKVSDGGPVDIALLSAWMYVLRVKLFDMLDKARYRRPVYELRHISVNLPLS